jgi:hypothetical protein
MAICASHNQKANQMQTNEIILLTRIPLAAVLASKTFHSLHYSPCVPPCKKDLDSSINVIINQCTKYNFVNVWKPPDELHKISS